MFTVSRSEGELLLLGSICISGNAWPDSNMNILLGVPIILLSHTQPIDPSSAVTNATSDHTTAHVRSGEQQTMLENRVLQAAIAVIIAMSC